MIKSYLGLVIIFAVQHQVSSLSANVEHRLAHRKDKMKALQDIQKRSEITKDPIDNNDLIVTEPSDTTFIKPALQHRHHHQRHRSGKGAKVTVTNYKPQIPQVANNVRRNTNLTDETNKTIQEDKDATTSNLNENQREKVATTQTQEDKDATTANYLNENRREGDEVATMQIQEDKDATTANYLNENRLKGEEVATTQTQEDKDATTANYLNENQRERDEVATMQIQEDKNATTADYLNKNRRGGEEIATKQTQEDKDATTANYLNENRRKGDEVASKQILEHKDATTANYLNENRRGEEEVATTPIQEDKDGAMSQKPVKTSQNVTPVVPIYRRVNYLNDHERNKPQKWTHCLDLVGPRLKGYKDNWRPKEVTNSHSDIKRLSELLSTDVSQYTEEEIVSLLYQISNIDLRIFQWDYSALTTVLNIIITGTTHDFRTLKAGVKYLFERWHLDTSMMQTFLEQTRIFRPPCIDISGTSGHTKKAGGVPLYTKPDKPTKKHRGGDESCHSREISTNNNSD